VLSTALCRLLDIEVPVIQAPIVPGAGPELVAAVSNAGGIGSLGAAFRSADQLGADIARVRELTDRPFIVNHVVPLVDDISFALCLEARPAAISLALGHRPELIQRVRDAGIPLLHQVHTVGQARQVAESGADVIIAQGSEAGGNSGHVAGSVLIPQVVDAVAPVPVVAAGGIADGRGLAAAIVLGACGANVGTRFLASQEATVDEEWKGQIVAAQSEEAVQLTFWQQIFRATDPRAFDVVPRSLRTPFTDRLFERGDVAADADAVRGEIIAALRAGTSHRLVPFTGQTAGLITDVLPAAEIVRAFAAEAEEALRRGSAVVG
jgi:nitronate monooxygenase/enoyl-[acyl-carrier protein] reductase II